MRARIIKYMCILSAVCVLICVGGLLLISYLDENTGADFSKTAVTAIIGGVVAFLICGLLSFFMADNIVDSIGSGKTDFSEIRPLFRRIEDQKSQIKSSAGALAEKEKNLATIMENMTEGLVLLDAQGLVISMNRAASELLDAPEGVFTGKHLFAVNRHPTLQGAVHAALGGTASQEMLDIGGAALQLVANPVAVDGVIRGAVLLIFDVSDRAEAEQMRREFSANVSHELKTPLTSISGYAELMKDGMVKPRDMERFSANIYNEAQRLISLIDDIIKLSRLDEQSESDMPMEELELMPIAFRVAERLHDRAKSYGVELMVSGDEETVRGNAQLIEEMLYNLCDNAIKYNRSGGHAGILTGRIDGAPAVTVSDDGIGIPKEHQARIFERFYRVDKSHSRDTGGTGLGLSIVKHGALFHSAEIKIDSEPDKGTDITLIFNGKGERDR